MITPQQFRTDFPEFTSSVDYPNSGISFWITVAYKMMNAERWLDLIDVGAELFVAHNLVLEVRAQKAASNGGVPGENTGPLSSKSVDKVSISYDTGAAMEVDAGHWNLTVYGTRYRSLVRMFGAGPIQIGIGYSNPLSLNNAWTGPYMAPSQTGQG